jgi:HEAT repeat protein
MKYSWHVVALLLACGVANARIVVSGGRKVMPDDQVLLTNKLTDAGDPKAIDQAGQLLTRADHQGASPLRDLYLEAGVHTLGAFRYKAGEKTILAVLSNPQLNEDVRDAALLALADMHDPATIPHLKTEAASLDRSELARCEAWRSLLDMGEKDAREKLMTEYKFRFTVEHPNNGRGVRDVLGRMKDAELMQSLSDLAKDPAMKEHKTAINEMVKQMKVNATPLDKLLSIAQNTKVGAAGQRFPALEAIGEYGTVEMIPDLLKLKAFDGQSASTGQTMALQNAAARAIGRIQQRYCEPMQKKGTPFVTDAEARLKAYHQAGSKP